MEGRIPSGRTAIGDRMPSRRREPAVDLNDTQNHAVAPPRPANRKLCSRAAISMTRPDLSRYRVPPKSPVGRPGSGIGLVGKLTVDVENRREERAGIWMAWPAKDFPGCAGLDDSSRLHH